MRYWLAILVLFTALFAAGNNTIVFQGAISHSDGEPYWGDAKIKLELFENATGGTAWKTIAEQTIVVANGSYSVDIPLSPAELDTLANLPSGTAWLEITISGNVLEPRVQLMAAPMAFSARGISMSGKNWRIGNSTISTGIMQNISEQANNVYVEQNVGIGTDNPTAKLHVVSGNTKPAIQVNGNLDANAGTITADKVYHARWQ